MAEQRTRDAVEERAERRTAAPESAPVYLMGRQAARAADADARRDGDPNRIEDGALSPTPERLSIGADREERMAREAKNVADGNHPLRIEEGALTEMPTVDPDEVEKEREARRKLMADNVRAGRSAVRIEDGAVTPMPPLIGATTDHPNAAMGKGD